MRGTPSARRRHAPARGREVLLTAGVLCVVVLVVTAILAVALPRPEQEGPRGELPRLARTHEIDLGVAVAVNPLTHDPDYQSVVTDNYTSVTAENAMKWEHVQPERHRFDWSGPDAIVDFAGRHDLDVHGHTLLWHNQQPSWLAQGDWDAQELREVMREHMEALLGRYQGRVTSWDVINEPFQDNGPHLRENLWYQVLGEDYIAEALSMAHEIDPRARLYVNEFGIEGGSAKTDAMYSLVTDLLDRGVPLHGIGFQGHFVHGNVPPDLAEHMRRFSDLGLEVSISELDVRIPEPPREQALREQEQEYRHVVRACLEVPRCVSVSVWGVSDQHSWIPEWFPGYTAALPFDEDYEPKPALDGMVEALSRRP
ncbi:1,4-beta-xylanase [Nocardiopsis sp. TSRI0078]|uniref:endo-1,4-beta-xylanase n=1 Tax=unclassified Nocardiopsis TaxID=2649073 RepID=UPI00093F2D54|nr:endo-1,4-beta-xylanase [Nocardiopsis sp. TSRI0078]OKI12384.1 1,4-beta-xylanase [Nocardiopsis sp. TSRI0078]